jgi:hypothetical protein
MQYSLAHQLGKRSGGLDPDAKAYIAAVETAGATVNATQKAAINTFVKTGKSDGWYSSIKRMYLPIWASAAPNAIDMIGLTSGTFNGTVTHSAGYVQGDGSTGYFLFDVAPSALGLTTSSGSNFVLTTAEAEINGSSQLGTARDANNNTLIGFGGAGAGNRSVRIFNSTPIVYPETDSRGVLLSSRTATTNFSSYKRTAGGFTTTINEGLSTAGGVGINTNMTIMALNGNGTISNYTPSTVRFGSYGMGLGMTAVQAENFTAALKTLWETGTSLTLP